MSLFPKIALFLRISKENFVPLHNINERRWQKRKYYSSIRRLLRMYLTTTCLSWVVNCPEPFRSKIMRFARSCQSGETSMSVEDSCMRLSAFQA